MSYKLPIRRLYEEKRKWRNEEVKKGKVRIFLKICWVLKKFVGCRKNNPFSKTHLILRGLAKAQAIHIPFFALFHKFYFIFLYFPKYCSFLSVSHPLIFFSNFMKIIFYIIFFLYITKTNFCDFFCFHCIKI